MMERVMDVRVSEWRPVRFLKRLIPDTRAVAAVEFAMLLPIMMTLYLGVVEVSQGFAISRKITLTARTVSDLASRVSTISGTEMTNILNASSTVMSPYPLANLKVVLTAAKIDANKAATVLWSDTLNGTVKQKDTSVALDPALAVADTTLIMAEVEYAYKPTIGYVLTGTLNLKSKMYMRPRQSTTVERTP
jgi:Flp pilus assembly protein TadG